MAKEERAERREERAHRAEVAKTRAETEKVRLESRLKTDAVNQARMLAQQRLAERQLQMIGPSAIARHEGDPKRMPMYVLGYDNRPQGGGPDLWFLNPELAESVEGVG